MEEIVRYSETFKLQVVREIEDGKHASCQAAREAYGIGGATTVQRWMRTYGRSHLLRKVVHVQTVDERSELRKAKARISELEQALVEAHLDLRVERAYLAMACEEGWRGPVDELKKKGNGMLPTARSKRAGNSAG